MKRIYVVGIGNAWASDDAVGPEVVRQLEASFKPALGQKPAPGDRPNVAFLTLTRPDLGLLDVLGRCDLLIVVDAVVSGAPPGHLHRQLWQPGVLASRGLERASSHGFGVREELDLAATLGRDLPDILLWGIEAAVTKPGQNLSPTVAAALPHIVDRLGQQLKDIVQSQEIGNENRDHSNDP